MLLFVVVLRVRVLSLRALSRRARQPPTLASRSLCAADGSVPRTARRIVVRVLIGTQVCARRRVSLSLAAVVDAVCLWCGVSHGAVERRAAV